MIRAIWLALAIAAIVAMAHSAAACDDEEPEAICTTDADCMKHCPPPADDPDCDGGPQ